MNRREMLSSVAAMALPIPVAAAEEKKSRPSALILTTSCQFWAVVYGVKRPLVVFADVAHLGNWHLCACNRPMIQHSINSILIQIDQQLPGELSEDDIELLLTREQADGIASSPEYRMMCCGAPDALCHNDFDYKRYEDVTAGRPATLVTGNHLYGIKVRVIDAPQRNS